MEHAISFYDQVLSVWGLFGLFVLAALVSTAGALAGLITRNLLTLIVLVLIVGGAIYYHHHLPLPDDIHIQLEGVKQKLR